MSTLIEFPAASGRSLQPQWRKELSERVREIQHRRQREAEEEAALQADVEQPPAQTESHLGLVPPSVDPSTLNPIVAAALRRLERAHRQPPPPPARVRSAGMNGASAATALARVVEAKQPERPPTATVPVAASETPCAPVTQSPPALPEKSKKGVEAERPTNFVMVVPDIQINSVRPSPPAQSATASPKQPVVPDQPVQPTIKIAANKLPATTPALAPVVLTPAPQPRRVFAEVVDDEVLSHCAATQEYNTTKAALNSTEIAPVAARFAGGIIDLLLIVFVVSPFAAIIELTSGDWTNLGVIALMCSIFLIMSFLYLAASTALWGRTCGMSLVSLRTVDATTRESPTMEQAVRRALLQMVSVAAFGFGLLYALLDIESRTAHDRLSGTIVIRE
ncbi:MAG: RDD family protein [Pyrinomonadaceae bacterium]|nr:RDD family protein [Pyrinomonadaceae bacterium]